MRLTLTAVATLAVLVLAGCGGGNDEPEQLSVGYAFGADVGDVGDRLAFRRLAQEEGFEPRFSDFEGPAQTIVALSRGDIQLAQLSYTKTTQAVAAAANVHAVLGSSMVPEFLLVGRPGIATPSDLRGKRVAYEGPGLAGEALVKHALKKGQLSSSDVKLSVIDDSVNRAAALTANRIDAAMLEEPDYERLHKADPGYRVVARMTEIWPPVPQTMWIVDRDWAKEHGDELKRIVSGLLDGYESVYTDEGKDAWIEEARQSFLQGDDAALAPALYAYYKGVRFWPTRGRDTVDEAEHDRAVRFFLGSGQIDKGAPYTEVWDPTFAEDAGD